VDWCQKEIRNGGFEQLFTNPTGNMVPWAIAGFRLIGADRYALILSDAALLLGPVYPTSGSARRSAWRALPRSQKEQAEKLDEAFIELLNSVADDLEQYRGNYVRRHPDQFV